MSLSTVTTIGELGDAGVLLFSDGYRTRKDQLGSGIPILRVAQVQEGRLVASRGDCIREQYLGRIGSKLSQPLDVLVTTKGTVGRVAFVPAGFPQHAYSPQLCFLRVTNHSELDPRWLYYWVSSPAFSVQARAVQGQTDMAPYISLRDFARFRIAIPRMEEQRRIAGVLGALDDLADAEMRISANCGELWRSIVSRNVNEQGSALAPLSALASFVNGRNFTKGATGQGRPVIRTPEVRGGPTASTVRTDADADADRVAHFGDVLFVWSGSLCCARWAYEDALVNQHVFKVSPLGDTPDWLVMFAIERQMPWFLSLAADKATTMGHIQRRHLDAAVELPLPPALPLLNSLVRPLWDQELESRAAAESATRLRDELLPLLMSGRVRVGEVAA